MAAVAVTEDDIGGAEFTAAEYEDNGYGFKPAVTVEEYVESAKPSAAWPTPALADGWIHAHRALRRHLKLILKTLECFEQQKAGEGLAAVPQAALDHFQAATDWFLAFMHEHHDIEERIVMPALQSKGVNALGRISADHPMLMRKAQQLGEDVQRFCAAGPDERDGLLGPLLENFKALYDGSMEHFLEEEVLFMPSLRTVFTKESYNPYIQAIIKEAKPPMTGYFLVGSMDKQEDRLAWCKQEGIPGFVVRFVFGPGIKKAERNQERMQQLALGHYRNELLAPKKPGLLGWGFLFL